MSFYQEGSEIHIYVLKLDRFLSESAEFSTAFTYLHSFVIISASVTLINAGNISLVLP